MTQFVGFGNGQDGALSITTNTTFNPVDSTFSGTAAATSGVAATGKSFATNDLVLIHYSRGANAGIYEINQITNYNSGTGAIDFAIPLANTYVDSGADQSQIIKMPQYSSVTVSAAGVLNPKTWTGDVGGITVFCVSGKFTNDGQILGDGNGFAGGSGSGNCVCGSNPSYTGEGTAGAQVFGTTSANGNGGGGSNGNGMDGAPGGGGGGNGAVGSQGGNEQNGTGGSGGAVSGNAGLTIMTFGGGGGGGRGEKNGNGNGGTGGRGGAIVFILAGGIAGNGIFSSLGANGSSASGSSSEGGGGGGGGGGGSMKFVTPSFTFTGTLRAYGGSGGSHSGTGPSGNGGNGGTGRIDIDACVNTQAYGSNPTPNVNTGGHSFCSTNNQML